MIAKERQRRLAAIVRERGATSVAELASQVDVSEATVRRDLAELDANGELVRTYGGAMPSTAHEKSFYSSLDDDHANKEAVARAAAGLVPEDGVVVLDIGTTTSLIARHLRGRSVTVITSNLGVFDELREDEAVKLVLLGGVLRRNFQSLVGPLTEAMFAQLSADICFLSCTGVRSNGHVLDDMAVEVPIKQAMIQAAAHTVLVAPETKFPGQGSLRISTLDSIDTLVTTAGAPQEAQNMVWRAGGKVVLA